MSHPVTVFRTYESVGRIVDTLKKETYNGFPVVEGYDPLDEVSEVLLENKTSHFKMANVNLSSAMAC